MMMLSEIKVFLWGLESKERALLIKLDLTLLPYFSLIWFLFGVNRASYASAYISGMKQAVGFEGKDYNYMNTIYLVAYAVCQIPGTSLLTIAPPRYVFVAANFLWSFLTLSQYSVILPKPLTATILTSKTVTFRMNHVYQLFVLNAFEGAFSAIA